MSRETVIRICQRLHLAGKKPTTALVKNRLASPLPLPLIIQGIQTFNANPDMTSVELPPEEPAVSLESGACCCEEKVQNMQKQIDQLRLDIRGLQAQVLGVK